MRRWDGNTRMSRATSRSHEVARDYRANVHRAHDCPSTGLNRPVHDWSFTRSTGHLRTMEVLEAQRDGLLATV